MSNRLIDISITKAYPSAEKHFFRVCGLDLNSAKHQRMWAEAQKIYALISGKLHLRAALSDFLPDTLNGNEMRISETVFSCSAFGQLEYDDIKRCYIYLLTVGDIEIDSDRITDLLYVDIWATAFIDAGRELLQQEVLKIAKKEDHDINVSASFGPGYYGMELEQISSFFSLLDGESIGVVLRENRIIIPLKTCTGMFLALAADSHMPPVTCEGCLGNTGGCRFCAGFSKREDV